MFGQGDEEINPSFCWDFSDPISSTRAQRKNFLDNGSGFGFRNYERKQEKYDIRALFEPKLDKIVFCNDFNDIISNQVMPRKQTRDISKDSSKKLANNSPVKSNKTFLSKPNKDLDTVSNTKEAEAFIIKKNRSEVEPEEDFMGFPILNQNDIDEFKNSCLLEDLYTEEKYEVPDLNCFVSLSLETDSSSLSVKIPSNILKDSKLLSTFL
jgi:hypothetical protein